MKGNNEQLYKGVITAWNSHNPEKILTFYADDVLFEDVAVGKTIHGKEELAAFIKQTFTDIPDFRIEEIHHFYRVIMQRVKVFCMERLHIVVSLASPQRRRGFRLKWPQ
jgi:steroid delta-isomerase-like uncharacterized protein